MEYFVYILECADKTYYCGYTTDLEKRVLVHNTSKRGAKYTLQRRPVILKYYEKFLTLSEALKREYQIKTLSREEKKKLMSTGFIAETR